MGYPLYSALSYFYFFKCYLHVKKTNIDFNNGQFATIA